MIMPFRTGSWSIQAKDRSRTRLQYFIDYHKARYVPQLGIGVPPEIVAEVVKRSKGLCEGCGDPPTLIHHVDGNRENNVKENLLHWDMKCHNKHHKARGERTYE